MTMVVPSKSTARAQQEHKCTQRAACSPPSSGCAIASSSLQCLPRTAWRSRRRPTGASTRAPKARPRRSPSWPLSLQTKRRRRRPLPDLPPQWLRSTWRRLLLGRTQGQTAFTDTQGERSVIPGSARRACHQVAQSHRVTECTCEQRAGLCMATSTPPRRTAGEQCSPGQLGLTCIPGAHVHPARLRSGC